jgi:quercetin dioxygenase-like cupin family protein
VVPEIRLFHGSDLERHEDEDGFIEILSPERSGVEGIRFTRFATYRGGRVPPHYHTTNSIAILVRGRASFSEGDWTGRRFDMEPGDYIVVPSGVVHVEETVGDETAEFVYVRDGDGGETVYVDDAEEPSAEASA